METILAKLAENIPSTVAVIVVVVLFLREQARMQREWSEQMERLVKAIDGLSKRVTEMEITVRPRRKRRRISSRA
jgi:hypothetical protein